MVSIQELGRDIIEIEKQGRLFEFYCKGIPLWWFARQRVFNEVFKQTSNVDLSKVTSDSLSYKEMTAKVIDAIHYNSFTQHNILAVSTSSARRDKYSNKDFDVFFDVLDWTDYREQYCIIETPDRKKHSSMPYSKSRYYGDGLMLAGNIARKTALARVGGFGVKNAIDDFSQTIHKALIARGYYLESRILKNVLYREFSFATVAVKVADFYLRKISPKILVVECGYSPAHMAIQYAAKKRGIVVCEMQHGLIAPDSMGYFFGVDNPALIKDSPFPDKILVYGEHFRKILLQNSSLCPENIKVVGNPYLWKKYKEKESESKRLHTGTILIASAPHDADFYISLANSLIRKIENDIIIKPHPSENGKEFYYRNKVLNSKRIKVCNATDSIYELLKKVEFHISIGSVTHLEAIALGVKDIILCKDGFEDYFSFLTQQGIPTINDIDQLAATINNYPELSQVYQYVKESVYAMDSNPIAELDTFFSDYW